MKVHASVNLGPGIYERKGNWMSNEETPGERVKKAIALAEAREAAGLERENFGDSIVVKHGEYIYSGNSIADAWVVAWSDMRGELTALPRCPSSLEGANLLLEKRRRAYNAGVVSPAEMVAPRTIHEWVDGRWFP